VAASRGPVMSQLVCRRTVAMWSRSTASRLARCRPGGRVAGAPRRWRRLGRGAYLLPGAGRRRAGPLLVPGCCLVPIRTSHTRGPAPPALKPLRRVGPQRAGDFGLRAEVRWTEAGTTKFSSAGRLNDLCGAGDRAAAVT
jgi:hypothetical protein